MRVLIVEDQDRLRKWLCKGLTEAGFAVDAAGDGREGLWYALSGAYDVIILDLMLPGLDGLSILERLRRAGRNDQVLILTAKDAVEDRVKGLDLGADDYLVKPFAFEELVARVRALVRRSYGRRSPAIEIGALRVDTVSRRVWLAGQPVELRAMEYRLLEYLAQRAGQVVTRTEIWEHLYGFDSQPQSNVVEVYIRSLRRKLDRPGGSNLIQTCRGLGYMLKAD